VKATNAKAAIAKVVFMGRNAPVNPIRPSDLTAKPIEEMESP
jgi:hypothetical protein